MNINILNIAADVVKLVKNCNLDAEVVVHEVKEVSVSQRLSKVEQVSQSKNCIVGVRAIANKNKAAYVSTNDLDTLSNTVNCVVEMARNAQEDNYINFETENYNHTSCLDLNILDSSPISIDALKDIAKTAESSALEHQGISNSEGATSSYTLTNMALCTASGFVGSFSKSKFSNYVGVVAGNNPEMKVGYDYDISCKFADLKSPNLMGQEAAQRAIRQLNSRTVKTGKYTVIFDRRAAKELVKTFSSAINGCNIYNDSSFLRNSLGEKIFCSNISIVDDPLLSKGIASRPFDGEGVASKKNICVKDGILQHWISDLYSAKKLRLHTTGNAMRSKNAAITPAPTNIYIDNGNISYEELINSVKDGICVTDLFGFGINLINANYSQGASGFFIENGEITYPVHEITVAGNLQDMFSNLIAANDLSFCGQFNSPTLQVSGMTVAG